MKEVKELEQGELTFWESVYVTVWPVVGKIFILGLIVIGIGFVFWAALRAIKKLKVDLGDFPWIPGVEFCGILAGV